MPRSYDPRVLVCALGDLTLDVIVRIDEPIARGGDTKAQTRLAPGGQAANVAAWAVELGAGARYIGKRGADEAGILASRALEMRGVEVVGPAEGRGGIICSLVDESGERSMLSDRGTATAFRPDELDPAWVRGCDHLFVSGYALLAEPVRETARAAVDIARARGAAVSVDVASWSAVAEVGAAAVRSLLAEISPDVVFANEDEDRIIGGPLPGTVWILKRGPRGCSFDGDERAALPVDDVVDSTGAGDALAAGYIVGGPDAALEAAARCVSQIGSMP
jgi:sugar/nucleoside kinase (ribokinase family)